MSEGMNKVFLMGNLGDEPVLKTTTGGHTVLSFKLATNETYLDKEGTRRELTEWHRAVLWGKRAEALAKILHKGQAVLVEGALRTHSYDDKDGVKRWTTEINVRELCLASGPRSARPEPALKLGLNDGPRPASAAPATATATAAATPAPQPVASRARPLRAAEAASSAA